MIDFKTHFETAEKKKEAKENIAEAIQVEKYDFLHHWLLPLGELIKYVEFESGYEFLGGHNTRTKFISSFTKALLDIDTFDEAFEGCAKNRSWTSRSIMTSCGTIYFNINDDMVASVRWKDGEEYTDLNEFIEMLTKTIIKSKLK